MIRLRFLSCLSVLVVAACGSAAKGSLFDGTNGGGTSTGTGGSTSTGTGGSTSVGTGGAGLQSNGGTISSGGAAASGGRASGGVPASGGKDSRDSGLGDGAISGPTISCGTTPCLAGGPAAQSCCAGAFSFCSSPLAPCPGGVNLLCDDATDCDPGAICCFSGVGACAFSCNSPALQLCRTDLECYVGTCQPFGLFPAYSVCQ